MSRRIGYRRTGYYLPEGYYDADWSYYTPKSRYKAYRKNIYNWQGRSRGGIGAAFGAAVAIDNWRIRGEYYDAYYKNTGKRPRYYSKVLRKKVRW